MRAIDADAFINRIVFHTDFETDVKELFEDEINAEPTIEPERKMGKWIKHIDDLFPTESTIECNACHHEQPLTIDDNYCPNCGLKMINGDGVL